MRPAPVRCTALTNIACGRRTLHPQGLLTTASKTNGRYTYKTATVPFLAEILKLVRRLPFSERCTGTTVYGRTRTKRRLVPTHAFRPPPCREQIVSSTILTRQRAQSPGTVRMNATWCAVAALTKPLRTQPPPTGGSLVIPHRPAGHQDVHVAESLRSDMPARRRRSVSRFIVPSVIYLVHNNVQFWTLRCEGAAMGRRCRRRRPRLAALPQAGKQTGVQPRDSAAALFTPHWAGARYVDAPTYQIMGNLKILTTGIFFRRGRTRSLGRRQRVCGNPVPCPARGDARTGRVG